MFFSTGALDLFNLLNLVCVRVCMLPSKGAVIVKCLQVVEPQF